MCTVAYSEQTGHRGQLQTGDEDMSAITIEIPDDLAEKLKSCGRGELQLVLRIGLEQLERTSQRNRIVDALRSGGLIEPLDPRVAESYLERSPHRRETPVRITGKPVSELIIEDRGSR